MNREELAWSGGFFEGEGSICIQDKTPQLSIANTDKDSLERFQAAVGLGNIRPRKPRVYSYERINSRKPSWVWGVSGFMNGQAVIAMLWPWLNTRRRARAKEVLLIAKTGQVRPGRDAKRYAARNSTSLASSVSVLGADGGSNQRPARPGRVVGD